jgi:hypothetical protein
MLVRASGEHLGGETGLPDPVAQRLAVREIRVVENRSQPQRTHGDHIDDAFYWARAFSTTFGHAPQ